MKYSIIMLEQPIIVSDETINEDNYYVAWETNYATAPSQRWVLYNNCGNGLNSKKRHKVIAGHDNLPSIINGLSLDEQIQIDWIDLYNLAESKLNEHPDFKTEGMSDYQNGRYNGIIEGLQLIQSINKNKFDLNVIKKAFHIGRLNQGRDGDTTLEQFVSKLYQSNPIQIKLEMERCVETSRGYMVVPKSVEDKAPYDIERPKLINNSYKVIKLL